MATLSLTEILESEHRTILQVVSAAAVLAEHMEAGEAIEPRALGDIVAFMRTYADKYHHGKEEAELFPFLVKRGVPTYGCPLAALTGEHQQGRALVTALSDAVTPLAAADPAAREAALTSLKGIAILYPNHIWKEDYLLFPMTNKVLNQEDQRELLARFERVDEQMGAGEHERFERLAAELTQEGQSGRYLASGSSAAQRTFRQPAQPARWRPAGPPASSQLSGRLVRRRYDGPAPVCRRAGARPGLLSQAQFGE